ncbi:hypothetical protein AOQ84DRAFT_221756 [Glonium stellatum]|uniref:Uncharacterized protein n=1 Tax=Glonium stellatum TaxID=574774 RepID=A0A8E2F123_9PEZI|nr:hypothetical protein AOQ84DRAFT_221756 [Glonium stellatum]
MIPASPDTAVRKCLDCSHRGKWDYWLKLLQARWCAGRAASLSGRVESTRRPGFGAWSGLVWSNRQRRRGHERRQGPECNLRTRLVWQDGGRVGVSSIVLNDSVAEKRARFMQTSRQCDPADNGNVGTGGQLVSGMSKAQHDEKCMAYLIKTSRSAHRSSGNCLSGTVLLSFAAFRCFSLLCPTLPGFSYACSDALPSHAFVSRRRKALGYETQHSLTWMHMYSYNVVRLTLLLEYPAGIPPLPLLSFCLRPLTNNGAHPRATATDLSLEHP